MYIVLENVDSLIAGDKEHAGLRCVLPRLYLELILLRFAQHLCFETFWYRL
jgi:hypothetical protein